MSKGFGEVYLPFALEKTYRPWSSFRPNFPLLVIPLRGVTSLFGALRRVPRRGAERRRMRYTAERYNEQRPLRGGRNEDRGPIAPRVFGRDRGLCTVCVGVAACRLAVARRRGAATDSAFGGAPCGRATVGRNTCAMEAGDALSRLLTGSARWCQRWGPIQHLEGVVADVVSAHLGAQLLFAVGAVVQ